MSFGEHFTRTMGDEGGYADVGADYGRETYRGISRRYHPGWVGWKFIDEAKRLPSFPRNIPGDLLAPYVEAFYREHFWDPWLGDEVDTIAPDVAGEVFDTGVMKDWRDSVRILQRALNVMNRGRDLYDDLKVDGSVGPKTLQALAKIDRRDIPALLTWMNVLQGYSMVEQMERDPSQEDFARGWPKRVQLVRREV